MVRTIVIWLSVSLLSDSHFQFQKHSARRISWTHMSIRYVQISQLRPTNCVPNIAITTVAAGFQMSTAQATKKDQTDQMQLPSPELDFQVIWWTEDSDYERSNPQRAWLCNSCVPHSHHDIETKSQDPNGQVEFCCCKYFSTPSINRGPAFIEKNDSPDCQSPQSTLIQYKKYSHKPSKTQVANKTTAAKRVRQSVL